MTSRDDVIIGTPTDSEFALDDLRWHTKWECDVLSRISKMNKQEKTSSCNSNDVEVGNESISKISPLEENTDGIKITTNITEGLYNIVFPLRFIALKKRSPDMYRQLMELESHLEERKLQVKIKW